MMQLLCNGVVLDLYDNTTLQFKHDNPLFAFDKLACERTTQFKLPTTPTNDNVLSLARIPAYEGDGMRRKFSAELQDGVVVKKGYLYVSEFDGKDYSAIFVTGELVGLQALKDAGSIRTILSDDLGYFDLPGTPKNIDDTTKLLNFDVLKYRVESGDMLPSSDLRWLIDASLTKLGVAHTIDNLYFRVIPQALQPLQKRDLTLRRYSRNMVMPTGFLANFFTTEVRDIFWYEYKYQEDPHDPEHPHSWRTTTTYSVQCLVPIIDITIEFPNDFPSSAMIISPDGTFFPPFLGTRVIDQYGNISGNPLAGSSVNILAGTPFYVVYANEFLYHEDQPEPYPTYWYKEWGWNPYPTANFGKVTIAGDEGDGENRIAVRDNIPDLTVVELCKIWAALTGTIINYSTANGLTFDTLDFSTFNIVEIDRVLKKEGVSRVFADYAQKNIVQFDSGEGVYAYERIILEYGINNDNIAEEKELQTIPFSEGGMNEDDVLVRSYNNKDVIASSDVPTGETWTHMQRVSLLKNTGIQSLCEASTQYKVQVRMTLQEYESINERTLLLIDGIKYVWTERSWQKDTATFVLARIV